MSIQEVLHVYISSVFSQYEAYSLLYRHETVIYISSFFSRTKKKKKKKKIS